MYYFVPSWYHGQRKWYDTTPLWFRVLERMSFDDSISQMRMLQEAEEASQFLLLNYQPQLRYFFHKQGLQTASYWSFFDDIQNIQSKEVSPFQFKDLNWPTGIRFIYSPFAVVVKQGEDTLAYIQFAENGNVLSVEWRKENRKDKDYIFDDRGFLSSILYYDKEQVPYYQDYLNENGVAQVRECLQDDQTIRIFPESDLVFQKEVYADWEELMAERLQVFKDVYMRPKDVLVVAADRQHNQLLFSIFEEQDKILSFFEPRQDKVVQEEIVRLISQASLALVDTVTHEEQLLPLLAGVEGKEFPLLRLSPFDTRLRLGSSQTMKQLLLYLYVDTISEETLRKTLDTILEYMDTNLLVTLQLVTFRADFQKQRWMDYVEQEVERRFQEDHFFSVVSSVGENQLEEDAEQTNTRVKVEYITNETQLIGLLDKSRLVLDLGQEPDVYTQIASISAGIPQLNCVQTDYVSHGENGWLVRDEKELKKALSYYLDGLTNWNRALVYAIQKMGDYTSGRILDKWNTYLKLEKKETEVRG